MHRRGRALLLLPDAAPFRHPEHIQVVRPTATFNGSVSVFLTGATVRPSTHFSNLRMAIGEGETAGPVVVTSRDNQ